MATDTLDSRGADAWADDIEASQLPRAFVRQDGPEITVAQNSDPVPVDPDGQGEKEEASQPGLRKEYVPDENNIVRLPADTSFESIRVEGDDLVVAQADGSVVVIKGGALDIPTFIIGDIELPRVTLIAALEANGIAVAFGANGSMSASGTPPSPPSSGNNFGSEEATIEGGDPQFLALLEGTEGGEGEGEDQELLDQAPDRGIEFDGDADGLSVEESDLPGGSTPVAEGALSGIGTISYSALDGVASITINGVALTFEAGQTIAGDFGVLTILSVSETQITYRYELSGPTNGDDVVDVFTVIITDTDGDTGTTEINVAIIDDVVSIGVPAASLVDEDDLPLGNHDFVAGDDMPASDGSLDPDASPLTAYGSLGVTWGADSANAQVDGGASEGVGDRAVNFTDLASAVENITVNGGAIDAAALTSHGHAITYSFANDGGTLVATADAGGPNERVVFRVTLSDQGAGSYAFELLDVLDHPLTGTEDDITLSFDFTATDSDGDTASSSFAVTVDDDTPVAGTPTLYAFGDAPAPSEPVFANFGSGDVNLTIPATGTGGSSSVPIVSTIVIPGGGSILDVNVNIDLQHTFSGDLEITLIAPDGTRIQLINDHGGARDIDGVLTFDDQAPDHYANVNLPAVGTGTWRPAINSLALLNGKDVAGTWQLEIKDDENLDTGILRKWSLDITTGTPPATGPMQVFESTAPAPISDTTTNLYTIDVAAGGTIADVNIALDIAHTFMADLDITLIAPDGTEIRLVFDRGGSGDANGEIVFDDEAALNIATAINSNAPFTGRWVPEGPLSALDGKPMAGTWTLRIVDDLGGDAGTLRSWKLEMTPRAETPSTSFVNAIVDQDDLTTGTAGGTGDVEPTIDPLDTDGDATTVVGDLEISWGADHPGTSPAHELVFTQPGTINALNALGLTSGGETITYALDATGTVLTASVGERIVFTVTLSDAGSGSFKFDLEDAIDDAAGGGENDVVLSFGYIATDSDGDPLTGGFKVGIDDDSPLIVTPASAIVDEDDLGNGNGDETAAGDDDTVTDSIIDADGDAKTVAGSLGVSWGADDFNTDVNGGASTGAGDRAVNFTNLASAIANITVNGGAYDAADLTSRGDAITYSLADDGATLIAMAGGREVFRVSLSDLDDGSYTFTLSDVIDHPVFGSDPSEGPTAIEDDLTFSFAFTATDSDGDTAASSFAVTVDDDSPRIGAPASGVAEEEEGAVAGAGIEDSDGAGDDDIVFLGLPIVNATTRTATGDLEIAWGADDANDEVNGGASGGNGDRAVNFTNLASAVANISINGGAIDPATLTSRGETITYALSNDGGTLIASAGGREVFRVTLSDEGSGGYTFRLSDTIEHPAGGAENTLTFEFDFTATDSDGDNVDSSFAVDVVDDVPGAIGTILPRYVEEEELVGGNEDLLPGGLAPDGDISFLGFQNLTTASAGGPLNIFWGGDDSNTAVNGGFDGTQAAGDRSVVFDVASPAANTAGAPRVLSAAEADAFISAPGGAGALTSEGRPIVFELSGDNTVLTARAGGEVIFTVTLTDTGSGAFDFVLSGVLDHPVSASGAANEDVLGFSFRFAARDGDGDLATGSFTVNVIDDTPVIGSVQASTVDEDDLAGGNAGGPGDAATVTNVSLDADGNPRTVAGSLAVAWGADDANTGVNGGASSGAGDRAVNFSNLASAIANITINGGAIDPATLTSRGEQVTYSLADDGATLIATAGAREVFRVSLSDLNAGSYTFTLSDVLDHPTAGTEDNLTFSFAFTATDSDGDTAVSSFAVTVDDDSPRIGAPGSGVVEEEEGAVAGAGIEDSDGAGDDDIVILGVPIVNATTRTATGDLEIAWGADDENSAVNGGASAGDGDRAVNFTNLLSALANITVNGGAIDPATLTSRGETITYAFSNDGGTLIASAGGREVFRVTLSDEGSGGYTFRLSDTIEHPAGGTENTLTFEFEFTATDSDGDSVDSSFAVGVIDDVPGAIGTILPRYVEEEELAGGNEDSSPFLPDGLADLGGAPLTQQASGPLNIFWGGDDSNTVVNGGFTGTQINGDRSVAFSNLASAAANITLTDGNGNPLDPAVLTSNGLQVQYELVAGSNGSLLRAFTSEGTVFTVSLSDVDGGSYNFILNATLDHPAGSSENELRFGFTFTARDGDGDPASGGFEVRVLDDTPVQGSATDSTVDEDNLPGGNVDDGYPGDVVGSDDLSNGTLGVSWGADNDVRGQTAGDVFGRSVAFVRDGGPAGTATPIAAGAVTAAALGLGALSSDGVALAYQIVETTTNGVWDGGYTLIAYKSTGSFSNAADQVFTLTLDARTTSGSYSFQLLGNLDHPASPANRENNIRLDFAFRAIDADGDVGGRGTFSVLVDDDAPVTTGTVTASPVLDDDIFGGNANGSGDVPDASTASGTAGALFNVGADGLGSVTLDSVTAFQAIRVVHGVASPESVVWGSPTTSAGGVTTWIATGAVSGDIVARLIVNADGSYSFTTFKPLVHAANGTNEEELAITFSYTVRDGDGDAATGSLTVRVDDDTPVSSGVVQNAGVYENEINGVGTQAGISDHEPDNNDGSSHDENYTGNLNALVNMGADGRGGYQVETTNLAPELLALTSGGVPLSYAVGADNTLIAYKTGGSPTNPAHQVFTFQVDPNTGQYSFRLIGSIDHTESLTISGVPVPVGAVDSVGDIHAVPELAGSDLAFVGRMPNGDVIIKVTNDGNSPVNWVLDNRAGGTDYPLSIASNTTIFINVGQINTPPNVQFRVTGSGAPSGNTTVNNGHGDDGVVYQDGQSLTLDMSSAVTARDGDGDTLALGGQLLITVKDDAPAAGAAGTASVDEAGLPSVQVDVESLGINFGADRAGASIDFAVDLNGDPLHPAGLMSDDVPLDYALRTVGGEKQLVAFKQGESVDQPVFIVALTSPANPNYVFTLYQNLDHGGASDTSLALSFTVVAMDGDGDQVQKSFTVNVSDDTTTAGSVTLSDSEAVLAGPDGFGGTAGIDDNPASFTITGSVAVAPGADGYFGGNFGTAFSLLSTPTLLYAVDPATGLVHELYGNSTVVTPTKVTYTAFVDLGAGDIPAYEISIEADGTVTYKQFLPLRHPEGTATDAELGLAFQYQLRDSEGDASQGTVTINVADGEPSMTVTSGTLDEADTMSSGILGAANPLVLQEDLGAGPTSGADGWRNLDAAGPNSFGEAVNLSMVYPGGPANPTLFHTYVNGSLVDFNVNGNHVVRTATSATLFGRTFDGVDVFSLTVNADGTVRFEQYRPLVNSDGTPFDAAHLLQFAFSVTDGDGDTSQPQIITVSLTNAGPTATADSYTVAEDGVLVVAAPLGVLANDSDPDVDLLRAVLVQGPAHGTLTLNADGSFTYTPTTNYNGPDSFTYHATDGDLNSTTVTVSLTVTSVIDHVFTEQADTVDLRTFSADQSPSNATDDPWFEDGNYLNALGGDDNVVLPDASDGLGAYYAGFYAANGVFDGGAGKDTITGGDLNDRIAGGTDDDTLNGGDGSDTILWSIGDGSDVVNGGADGATGDTFQVTGNGADQLITITAADNDANPANGVQDPISIAIDQDGNGSAEATVSLTEVEEIVFNLGGGNDQVIVNAQSFAGTSLNVSTIRMDLGEGNDTLDLSSLKFSNHRVVANGGGDTGDSVILGSENTGAGYASTDIVSFEEITENNNLIGVKLTFDTTPGVPGGEVTHEFRNFENFEFSDGSFSLEEITNDAPVAQSDLVATLEDTPISVNAAGGVLANDTDADGHALQVVAGAYATTRGGTIVFLADGGYTYTPAANFNGVDSVTYTVVDPFGAQDTGQLTINVAPVNDAPSLAIPQFTMAEDTTIQLTGLSVADPDSQFVTVTLAAPRGTLDVTSSGGVVVVPGVPGMVSITGSVANINALFAAGNVRYTAAPNDDADVSISFEVQDGQTATQGSFTIDVTPVNDAPVNAVPATITISEDAVLSLSGANLIQIADIDAGGGNVEVTLTASNGLISLDGGNSWSSQLVVNDSVAAINGGLGGLLFRPTQNFHGVASVQVTTNDQGNTGAGGARSDTDVVMINVTPVNDAPSISIPQFQMAENSTIQLTGLSVADPDSHPITITLAAPRGTLDATSGGGVVVVSGMMPGVISLTGSVANLNAFFGAGNVRYTAAANDDTDVAISFEVYDGQAATQGSFTIDVTPVNDAPTSADFEWDFQESADGQYPIYLSDFAFSDVEDAGSLPAAVRIVSLPDPLEATLFLLVGGNPVAVQAGQEISAAAIDAGDLYIQLVDRAADYDVTFEFKVLDSDGGASATHSYTVNVDALAGPTANPDTNASDPVVKAGITGHGDSSAIGNVLANDSGDTLTVVGAAAGSQNGPVSGNVGTFLTGTYGTLVLSANGGWIYTLLNGDPDTVALAQGTTGQDVFSYTIQDVSGFKSTTTLTINVAGNTAPTNNAGNDAPVSADFQWSLAENGADWNGGRFSFFAQDFEFQDAEDGFANQFASVRIVGLPNAQFGTLYYADGDGNSANDVPVGLNAQISYVDIDLGGIYLALADRSQDYAVSFQFKVVDSNGAASSDTYTYTINVDAVNDAPAIGVVDVTGSVTEDADVVNGELVTTGAITFNDADGDLTVSATPSYVTAVGNGASISADLLAALQNAFKANMSGLGSSGTVDWQFAIDNNVVQYLGAGQSVTATYRITVSDGAASSTQDVTVTINGGAEPNAAPFAASYAFGIGRTYGTSHNNAWAPSHANYNIDLVALGVITDADGQALTWSSSGLPSANWSLSSAGVLSFNQLVPSGVYQIQVTASDGVASASRTVEVWVAGALLWVSNPTGGDDTLFGTGSNDTISGSDGNDFIFAAGHNDTLNGGIGNDVLYGGPNDALTDAAGIAPFETLSGGNDRDYINGEDGKDRIFGGAGNDYLVGGNGDDTLDGEQHNDIILGGAGNDSLTGGDGDDILVGGAGADTLLGGNGVDTVDYSGEGGLSGVIVNLNANPWDHDGDGGTAAIAVNSARDTFGQTDSFGAGSPTGVEGVVGTNWTDYINGSNNGSVAETLQGLGGDDFIFGNNGADILVGGAGNDLLSGGGQDDVLIGGAGLNTVTGGGGNDTFVIDASALAEVGMVDVITDFASGDILDLSGLLDSFLGPDVTLAEAQTAVTRSVSGGNTTIFVNDGSGAEAVAVLQNYTSPVINILYDQGEQANNVA